MPDGRLLAVRHVGEELETPPIVLVDNWAAEFD
jgi:hypothetical protein